MMLRGGKATVPDTLTFCGGVIDVDFFWRRKTVCSYTC